MRIGQTVRVLCCFGVAFDVVVLTQSPQPSVLGVFLLWMSIGCLLSAAMAPYRHEP